MEKYRLQRRLMGPTYSSGQVKDYEAALDKAVSDDVAIMHEIAGKPESVDLWFNYFALGRLPLSNCHELQLIMLDCLSSATFSTSYGMIRKGHDDGSIAGVHDSWYYMHWAGFVPTFIKYRKMFLSFIARLSSPAAPTGPPPMFSVSNLRRAMRNIIANTG